MDLETLYEKKGFYLCYKSSIIKNITFEKGENLIFVGPEGGWSENEISDFKKRGFTGIKLAKNILRSETAAVLSVGVLNYLLSEVKEDE